MSVNLKDFHPLNKWEPDVHGPGWYEPHFLGGGPRFVIDKTTGRKYLNQSRLVVAVKCFALLAGTPIYQTLLSAGNIAFRILRLATLSHFWYPNELPEDNKFKARLTYAGKDLLRIVATPIAILGLELAALYGVFNPYDGRKLYASIERALYENDIIVGAPCFQPDPKRHAFGISLNNPQGW